MPLMRKKPVGRMPFGRGAGRSRSGMAGAMQMPQQGLLPRRQPRERAVKEVGQKPTWARTGWSSIPVIGGLLDLLRNIIFPREVFRATKRTRTGTGLGKAARDKMLTVKMNLRAGRLTRAQQVKALRNRTPGLRETLAAQHGRGRIKGVPNYPGKKAA